MNRHAVPLPVFRTLCHAFSVGMLWFVVCEALAGTPQDDSLPVLRQVPVPELQPELWPPGDWKPVRVEKFQSLLEVLDSEPTGPQSVWIMEAEYRATCDVANDVLTEGTLRARLKRAGNKATLLMLDPLNLAIISDLRWEDGDAVWGTTPDGRTAVVVDRDDAVLLGEWCFRGRRLPHRVEFDIHVAPANVSRLWLQVPNGWTLKSEAGDVMRPPAEAEPTQEAWKIDLGSQTHCRVSAAKINPDVPGPPSVFYDQSSSFMVGRTSLQLQVETSVETFKSPVSALTFLVPDELELDTISYAGDTPLSWEERPASTSEGTAESTQRQVIVHLPAPILGRSRPVRVVAHMSVKLSQPWRLPHLRLAAGTFRAGKLYLSVRTPLQLRTFQEMRGLRQDGPVSTAAEGETFPFSQHLPDASLTVDVGYPDLALSSQAFALVNADARKWSLTADVKWTARSGSTFSVKCQVPREWKITDVRSVLESDSVESDLAYWAEKRSGKGTHSLIVEFKDALMPGEPKNVLISAERPPPGTNRSVALPVLQPMDCRDVDVLLAFSHREEDAFNWQAGESFEQTELERLPEYWQSFGLWSQISNAWMTRFFVSRSNRLDSAGFLQVGTRQPLVDASATVTVQLGQNELTESFLLRCNPVSEPVDRVWVYLTSNGSDLVWRLVGTQEMPLDSTRIPASRHEEWELPPSGELWEIRFATPQRREFRIVADRTKAFSNDDSPALAFVPRAHSFRGTVTLSASDAIALDVDAHGLQPLQEDGASAVSDTATQTSGWRGRRWQYQQLSDTLTVGIAEDSAQQPSRAVAAAELKSVIVTEDGGRDRHWARFYLDPDMRRTDIDFELPEPAVLIGVTVNGQATAPSRSGTSYTIPTAAILAGPDEEIGESVEIEYYTPSQGAFLRNTRTIVTPRLEHTVLHFTWMLALPSGTRISALPSALRSQHSWPKLPWTRRFFGPLGRTAGSPRFNPFLADSWLHLLRSHPVSRELSQRPDSESFAPAGWTVHRAVAADLPVSLTLEIWNGTQLTVLAWIGLLFSLAVGLLLRALRLSGRSRIGGCWLATCLVAVWLTPTIYGEIAGGCLVGATVAVLLPRRLLVRCPPDGETQAAIPLGTTVFHKHPSASNLLLCAVATAAVAAAATAPAQDSQPPPSPVPKKGPAAESTAQGTYDVLAPVDSNGKPSAKVPLVFVSPELLERLGALAQRPSRTPEYLIASAEYRGDIDDQDAVVVRATFRVTLLASKTAVRLFLPLRNANLSPSGCRVNGVPHDVVRAVDRPGFYVELSRNMTAQPGDRSVQIGDSKSSDPAAESATVGPAGPEEARTFEVDVTLHPSVTSRSGVSAVKMGIPPVAASRATFHFSRHLPTAQFPDARGQTDRSLENTAISAELGSSDELTARWSAKDLASVPTTLSAELMCAVAAHPTQLHFHHRVKYRVESGEVDFVSWRLPAGVVLRDVLADNLARHETWPGQDGTMELLIEFSKPQTAEFLVEAHFTAPNDKPDAPVTVAMDDFLGQRETVQVRSTRIGLNTASGYELSPVTVPAERATVIDPAVFADLWGTLRADTGARQPQLAYQVDLPAILTFAVEPLTPQRRILRMNQVAQVERDRLQWTVTAELETSRSPAFSHTLLCDQRLRIESIVVREAEADRLARWSRMGSRIVLFLKDKTIGIQTIVLKGSLPLAPAGETMLPVVRFEEAESVDSQLRVYHDPGTTIEVVGAKPVSPTEESAEPTADNGIDARLKRYQLPADTQDPRIRVSGGDTKRVEYSTASFLGRHTSGKWLLSIILKIEGPSRKRQPFQVVIPSEISQDSRVTIQGATHDEKPLPDGSKQWTVRPSKRPKEPLDIKVSALVSEPSDGPWQLPNVSVAESELAERFLVVSAADGLNLANPDVERLDVGMVPGWVRDAEASGPQPNDAEAYRSSASRWTVTRNLPQKPARSRHAPLVDTQIWVQDDGTSLGRTDIYVAGSADGSLSVSWPAGIQLRALLVDSRPIRTAVPGSEGLTVPLDLEASERAQVVRVFWSRSFGGRASAVGQMNQTLPMPQDLPIERVLLTLFPAAGTWVAYQTGLAETMAVDVALDYLEGLLTLSRGDDAGSVRHKFLSLIVGIHDALNSCLDPQGPQSELFEPEQRQRLAALTRDLQILQETVGEATWQEAARFAARPVAVRETWRARLASQSGVLCGRIAVTDQPVSVSLWTLRYPLWILACALLAGMLAVPCFCKLLDRRVADWLFRHPAVPWMLLGFIWWIALMPSIVGVLLWIGAIALAFRRPTRHPKAESSASGGSAVLLR